jgi:L-ascorbate metabolism protein UlaG (beta-lactamase superfamily)
MLSKERFYLRQNVQVEPLVDRWYAWPHLISPATAARNITERHLKIMSSYLSAPQIHASAVKNPKMLGGPFIDYGGERVDEIRELQEFIKTKRRHLIELSAALGELDAMLKDLAKGYSLQPLYAQIPDILKGYVELVYDLNNHPSFRLIEPLLYRSKHYDRSQQSLMLSTITMDSRPFVLSTPRLDSDDNLNLAMAFDDPAIDELFQLKTNARPAHEIKEMLRLTESLYERMSCFLTSEAPPPYIPYTGKGVRWRYFGHACILIESQGISLLFDPVLSYTYEGSMPRYTYADLPDSIDYVLITHDHQDHVLFETLLQIRHKVIFENCGFKNVIEINEMQEIGDERLNITGLPFFGEHADLDIRSKMAWLVRVGPHSLLFAADSCNIEPRLYEHLHRDLGDVDALFLGMECDGAPLSWLYGPLLTERLDRAMDESRRLAGSNCEQGMKIVDCLNCLEVYVYAMGQEPWLNYIMSIKYTDQSRPIVESNRLVKTCQERGIRAERLFGEKEILIERPQRRALAGSFR